MYIRPGSARLPTWLPLLARAIAILQICRRGGSYLLNTPSHPAMMKMSTKLEWCISDVLRFTRFDSKKRMYLSRPGKNDLADSWWLMNQKFVEQPGPSPPIHGPIRILVQPLLPLDIYFLEIFSKKNSWFLLYLHMEIKGPPRRNKTDIYIRKRIIYHEIWWRSSLSEQEENAGGGFFLAKIQNFILSNSNSLHKSLMV